MKDPEIADILVNTIVIAFVNDTVNLRRPMSGFAIRPPDADYRADRNLRGRRVR
jgi:hypothetical protein